MSMDKAIESGKEHRKKYYGSKEFFATKMKEQFL